MVPSYYEQDPNKIDIRCGKSVKPNLASAADEGSAYARANLIKPWKSGETRIVLAVIDMQLDFITPPFIAPDGTPDFDDNGVPNPSAGNLAVPGAVADVDRLNRFIYSNTPDIEHIVASSDTHFLYQPFHPYNWIAGPNMAQKSDGSLYSQGEHPEPFTTITLEQIENMTWLPVRSPGMTRKMVKQLENDRKKTLMIWPLHCILGTPGHAFDPTFMEAMFFHSSARFNQYSVTTKGTSPYVEHYGILKAEVEIPEDAARTQLNANVLNLWREADRVYFAGQAKSHCVLETLEQVISEFSADATRDALLKKIFVLEDCMSSVPGFGFEAKTNARFDEFRKMGVNFVKSTDPLNL